MITVNPSTYKGAIEIGKNIPTTLVMNTEVIVTKIMPNNFEFCLHTDVISNLFYVLIEIKMLIGLQM